MRVATLITGNHVQCIVIFIISIISYAVTKNKILFIIYPKMCAWLVIPRYIRPWLRIYSQIYLVTVPIVGITYFSIWESVIRYFTVNNIVYSFRLASVNQTEFNCLTLIVKSWKTHPEIFLKFSISGSWPRPFTWKTHQTFFRNFNFGVVS